MTYGSKLMKVSPGNLSATALIVSMVGPQVAL
jgi:hypothetical protein